MLQGSALQDLHHPPLELRSLGSSKNPLFIRRGFRPLSKPLANLWQEA